MRDQKPEVRNRLREKQDMDAEMEKAIEAAIAEFQPQFDSGTESAPASESAATEEAVTV